MGTEICIYCGEYHLDIALGSHMRECEKTHPKRKYSLVDMEERITKLEQTLKDVSAEGGGGDDE